jgi:hypothetical protein
MNILLIILAVMAGIIVLLLVIALFIKSSYSVARGIIIDKTVPEVFAYVKYLRNQDYYSKWVMLDPGMKKEFRGTDGTPGFVYAWDSQQKNAGKGEQEIKKVKEGESITVEIRFEKPFKAVSDAVMSTTGVGSGRTEVAWAFASSLKYPMNIMLLFMNFDKVLGKDMDTSLTLLKGILEQKK